MCYLAHFFHTINSGDFVIKISRYLYVHFTFLFLIAVCYFNRNLEILAVNYGIIFFHELAHLSAALLIGLKPAHIVFFPFGVNLKLKNTFVYSIADEILLYMSGPLLNAVLALLTAPFIQKNEYFNLFYYGNLSLCLFNLLPILPMDGGTVLKKILSGRVGYRRCEIILKITSLIFISLIISAQVYLLKNGSFNFSFLFATIFLTCNIFTNREKYHLDFVKELIYINKKDKKEIKKVKMILIKDGCSYKEVAKNFSRLNNYVVIKEDMQGKIYNMVTEKEIIAEILK